MSSKVTPKIQADRHLVAMNGAEVFTHTQWRKLGQWWGSLQLTSSYGLPGKTVADKTFVYLGPNLMTRVSGQLLNTVHSHTEDDQPWVSPCLPLFSVSLCFSHHFSFPVSFPFFLTASSLCSCLSHALLSLCLNFSHSNLEVGSGCTGLSCNPRRGQVSFLHPGRTPPPQINDPSMTSSASPDLTRRQRRTCSSPSAR